MPGFLKGCGLVEKVYRKVDLTELVPYENNPRKNDDAVPDVEESIRQVGYITPIVVDENSIILCGHTRLKALQKAGIRSAEVLIVSGLSEEQKAKYRLLDNKTGEKAKWDMEKLEKELSALDFDGYDFGWDISAVGGMKRSTAPKQKSLNMSHVKSCLTSQMWWMFPRSMYCLKRLMVLRSVNQKRNFYE